MNKKDKLLKEQEYKDLIDFNKMSGKKYGVAKCWKGTNYRHWRVMSDIVFKLVNDYSMNVITEAVFKKGGRADVFAYKGDLAVIIEVLHSEKDEKFEFKKNYYPKGITMMKVKTKEFKMEEFCI